MYTGAGGLENIGQVLKWKDMAEIPSYVFPGECGRLTGSAGEFFPPEREATSVDFFSPDLCR